MVTATVAGGDESDVEGRGQGISDKGPTVGGRVLFEFMKTV